MNFSDFQDAWRHNEPGWSRTGRRHERWEQLKMWLGLLACLAGIVVAWAFVYVSAKPSLIALAVGVTAFILAAGGAEWRLRRMVSTAMVQQTQAFVDVLKRQLELEWRIWRLNAWGLGIVTLGILFWVPWRIWEDLPLYRAHPMNALVGIAGIVLMLLGQLWWLRRKWRRLTQEGARLHMLAEEFEESETHLKAE